MLAKKRNTQTLQLYFSDMQLEIGDEGAGEHTENYSQIKVIVSDGAPELMCKALEDALVRREGICKFATAGYTPSQNQAENIVKIVTQGVAANMDTLGGPRRHWIRAQTHFSSHTHQDAAGRLFNSL